MMILMMNQLICHHHQNTLTNLILEGNDRGKMPEKCFHSNNLFELNDQDKHEKYTDAFLPINIHT